MVDRKKILKIIASESDCSVDRAMAAALPTAGENVVSELVPLMLERKDLKACESLVVHFHLLTGELQGMVINRLTDLYVALRKVSQRRGSQGPSNVLSIIRQAKAYSLAYMAGELLRHGLEDIRRQAAQVLYDLVECAILEPVTADGEDGADGSTGVQHPRQLLIETIEQAVLRYDSHRQPLVLRAMAKLLPCRFEQLTKELEDWRCSAIQPLRDMAEDGRWVEIRRILLWMLSISTLQPSAVAGICQAAKNEQLADILESGYLMLAGEVAAGLEGLEHVDHMWPTQNQMMNMAPVAMRQLPKWAALLPSSEGLKIRRLSQLAHLPDTTARIHGLRMLLRCSSSTRGYHEAVAMYCYDREQSIARIALQHLLGCHWEGIKALLLRLVNSEHEDLRTMSVNYLAPRGFASLWQRWEKLSFEQRLAVGRGLIKMDSHFHEHLGRKLELADQPSRLRAIAMVRELNQGQFFEQALIALVCCDDAKVVASAVRALGTAKSDSAVSMLEAALDHSDSRVRANAIEALDQVKSKHHIGTLVKMAAKEANRPRANAIKALMGMRAEDAMLALRTMLDDCDTKQRISALWLVETMGILDLARQVAELAVSDGSRQVSVRAKEVVQGLIKQMDPNGEMTDQLASVQGRSTMKAG